MQILSPSAYRTMPWKNGLGITHEIAAQRSDEDKRSGGFAWRLSMAEVAASAPFSRFAGCDRVIVLLSGDGMVLDSGEHGCHRLDQPLAPYPFSGDWSTDCRLLGGPCRDFNVMVDRARVQATVRAVKLSPQPQTVAVEGARLALYTASGCVQVGGVGLAQHRVPAQHTLLANTDGSEPLPAELELAAEGSAADALLIWLRPHRDRPSQQTQAPG